mgnify:CR=1 FL=1
MNTDNRYHWPHKDLLDVTQLSAEDTMHLLDLAASFQEINSRPVKKVPTLKGKTVVLFFVENSTRTKTSFDVAGKRLSADTYSLAKSGSSLNKGESLKDTALTLQAMSPDVIVIRHSSSGAAQFLAERLHCGVVNAGDGWHAHPTQALLDAFSLRQVWGGERDAFKGKNLLILGDCAHSRVCRSNVLLLTKLGVNVSLCAPRTLLPAGVDNWPVTVYTDSKKELDFGAQTKAGEAARQGKKLDSLFNQEQLSPMNVMQRMAGWNPNSAWYSSPCSTGDIRCSLDFTSAICLPIHTSCRRASTPPM